MIRAHEGDLTGMAGMIRAHWGEIGATAGMIRAHDGAAVHGRLPPRSPIIARWSRKSEAFWAAPVPGATGKSFADGFANPLLAKYGIDLDRSRPAWRS